jgi:hypothetical protein
MGPLSGALLAGIPFASARKLPRTASDPRDQKQRPLMMALVQATQAKNSSPDPDQSYPFALTRAGFIVPARIHSPEAPPLLRIPLPMAPSRIGKGR